MSSFDFPIVPVMRPKAPPRYLIEKHLGDVLESDVFANRGPKVRALEARLAEFVGCDASRLVVTNSGSTAIRAAAYSLGGDTWACPSYIFPAAPLSLQEAGKKVRFYDSCDNKNNLSAYHDQDGVLIGGLFGNLPPNYPTGAKRVIFDLAASLGNYKLPEFLATMPKSSIATFSLHATKVLGSGEGGFAVCGDSALAEDLRTRINFGFEGTRESLRQATNGKLSEFSAAIAHAALDNWQVEKLEWQDARRLVKSLEDSLNLCSIVDSHSAIAPYWVIKFDSSRKKNSLVASLQSRGIQTRDWWENGCHSMAAFKEISSGDFSETETFTSRTVGLPFFRGLSAETVQEIGGSLASVLEL